MQPPATGNSRNPSDPPITGAILAGGYSRRLGQDKATLALRGKPLARWVAEALTPVAPQCWLITNHPQTHLILGLPLVTDLYPFQGPGGGLLTALFYARTPWVLVAATDNPFLASSWCGSWPPGPPGLPSRPWSASPPGAWSPFRVFTTCACCRN